MVKKTEAKKIFATGGALMTFTDNARKPSKRARKVPNRGRGNKVAAKLPGCKLPAVTKRARPQSCEVPLTVDSSSIKGEHLILPVASASIAISTTFFQATNAMLAYSTLILRGVPSRKAAKIMEKQVEGWKDAVQLVLQLDPVALGELFIDHKGRTYTKTTSKAGNTKYKLVKTTKP